MLLLRAVALASLSAVGFAAPNILFVMSDDHAVPALSAYGGGLNATPNLNRLATEGVRFDAAFVTNSICTPSRAVVLTGKHSHKNGVLTLRDEFDGSPADARRSCCGRPATTRAWSASGT